jgi:hypothetical protein
MLLIKAYIAVLTFGKSKALFSKNIYVFIFLHQHRFSFCNFFKLKKPLRKYHKQLKIKLLKTFQSFSIVVFYSLNIFILPVTFSHKRIFFSLFHFYGNHGHIHEASIP